MTFRTLIDDAAERLGNSQPEARVRFRRFLNEWYRRILADTTLSRGTAGTSLAVLAGTADYTLASTIGRIKQIYSPTYNHVLEERPLSYLRELDPMDTVRGIPTYFALVTDRVIKLAPIPSANDTLKVDHDAAITEMDDDADVPIIPEDFHYLLSLGIRINEYEKNEDSRLRNAQAEMVTGMARLRYWLASRASNVSNPAQSMGIDRPWSRLGGWYPRG